MTYKRIICTAKQYIEEKCTDKARVFMVDIMVNTQEDRVVIEQAIKDGKIIMNGNKILLVTEIK